MNWDKYRLLGQKMVVLGQILLVLGLFLAGCVPPGPSAFIADLPGPRGAPGKDGAGCTAKRVTGGVLISCGDEEPVLVEDGATGEPGKDGKDGVSCAAMPADGGVTIFCGGSDPVFIANGQDGSQGPRGDTGATGEAGSSCGVTTVAPGPAAPNGGSLIACTDGSQSLVLNGTNGADGQAGTVVTPIPFCPGVSAYPTSFIESGFCINGRLWAVYSANGGFLTEVLPGNWSSNAIGSSCNFTVKPNCEVTNY
jgi:hypothetical protein